MSGFDGLFRTQALVGSWMMEKARRDESARQFDVGAFQQQQALDMRQAESDSKLGLFEQEQQLNAHKLMQMQGLDQAKMSRLATEEAEISVKERRIQLQVTEQKLSGGEADFKKTMEEIQGLQRSAMGKTPEDRLAGGFVPDPSNPLNWRKAESSDELSEAQGSYASLKDLLSSGDYRARDRKSIELHRELGILRDPMARAMLSKESLQLAEERASAIEQELSRQGLYGPRDRGGKAVERPEQDQDAPEKPREMGPIRSPYQSGSLMDNIWSHDRWTSDPFWKGLADDVDPQTGRPFSRDVMAYVMAKFGPGLAEFKGWQGQIDALMFSAAEKDPQVLGFLLKASPVRAGEQRSDEDIRRILRSRFGLTDHAMEFTMRSIDQAFEWLFQKEQAEKDRTTPDTGR